MIIIISENAATRQLLVSAMVKTILQMMTVSEIAFVIVKVEIVTVFTTFFIETQGGEREDTILATSSIATKMLLFSLSTINSFSGAN